ncbi:MAG: 2-C-methyl-D-erythritol 2,4-cyclodiphosphate synthase [Armatimonadota bacterium]
MYKIGIGIDIHPFAKDRKLILGGVEIPADKGLAGYSDADVLVHAIMDAILGALSLGDIGQHFPDTDPMYEDISSLKLLILVEKMMRNKGYKISNLDTVIVAQMPKVAPYFPQMKENLSSMLKTKPHKINLKATTSEKLGSIGRSEGIMAQAVVLLRETDNRLGY